MFIELFIIIEKWKQPECPSTDEWINKRCYTHTKEYFLAIKKEKYFTMVYRKVIVKRVLVDLKKKKKANFLFLLNYND